MEFIDQGARHDGARSAHGMAQCDHAAIHVKAGIIDAKLQADAARQLGNQELAAQKFQQSLFLQEQRQQHDMMIAQARAEARTPRNQPMSGAGLFDPMAMGQQIFGSIPQY